MPWVRAEDENSVAHQNRLLDVVCDDQHGFGRQLMVQVESDTGQAVTSQPIADHYVSGGFQPIARDEEAYPGARSFNREAVLGGIVVGNRVAINASRCV